MNQKGTGKQGLQQLADRPNPRVPRAGVRHRRLKSRRRRPRPSSSHLHSRILHAPLTMARSNALLLAGLLALSLATAQAQTPSL